MLEISSLRGGQDIHRDRSRCCPSAAEILGTSTLRDTVNGAMLEIVYAKRRLELVALFSEQGRFDLDAAEHAWGGDD